MCYNALLIQLSRCPGCTMPSVILWAEVPAIRVRLSWCPIRNGRSMANPLLWAA